MKKFIVNECFHSLVSTSMELCANEKELRKIVEEIGSLICLKTLNGELTKENKKMLKRLVYRLSPMDELIDIELAKIPKDKWFEQGAEWYASLKIEEMLTIASGVMDLWSD